jgi:hypothetical protein
MQSVNSPSWAAVAGLSHKFNEELSEAEEIKLEKLH